jgi:hypothetical protein
MTSAHICPCPSPSISSQVFQDSLEARGEQCTLDPVWNYCCSAPLPLPLVSDMSCRHQLDRCLPLDSGEGLSAAYGLICDEMQALSYSGGILKIEVLDGERFNPDIHMGEAQVRLSSLGTTTWASPIQTLSLKGRGPADRVSGKISFSLSFVPPDRQAVMRMLQRYNTPNISPLPLSAADEESSGILDSSLDQTIGEPDAIPPGAMVDLRPPLVAVSDLYSSINMDQLSSLVHGQAESAVERVTLMLEKRMMNKGNTNI